MNKIKSIVLSTLFTATTMVGGLAGQAQALGNASLSMAGGSHQAGSSFAVPIYVNSGADPVNVVQADFSYNASQLQFQGVSCGGSFGITAGAGANSVTCGVAGGASVTGSQLVAVANFKALAGSGSSVISIAPSSHVYRSTDNTDVWNGVPTSTGISFSSPAPVTRAPVTPASQAPAETPDTATPVKAAVKKPVQPKVAIAAPVKTSNTLRSKPVIPAVGY
ncbi:cohesin domain-containing protein [Candidatus Saccharibacteria bacterium]|nr:cohesin domain-containing protein [Candidatus Saccharibacteria bacterium]